MVIEESLKGKRLLVTGGSGFLGSRLIKQLEKENPKEILNFDMKNGHNLTEYREVEEFLENHPTDIVFDLATIALPASLKFPYKVINDVSKMILNLCELQRKGLFGRLIHMSSSEAYGTATANAMDETHSLQPRTPYAAAKAAGDLIALSYFHTFGSDIIIPRSFNVYGPYQPLYWGAVIPKTIQRILLGEAPIIFNDGSQTRDFVFVEDSVKAIILISKLEEKGIVVNIGTGIETSIYDLVHLIKRLMGYKGKIEQREQRNGDVSRHRANTDLLYKLTGYKPRTKLEDGLRATIKYYANLKSDEKICY